MPFEQAVVEAGALLGCEPFLSEEKYREELRRLRILDHDLEEVVKEDLGPRASERVGRRTTRAGIRLVMLRHPIHEEKGAALTWLLSETRALSRFRSDTPDEARRRLLYWARSLGRRARGRGAERVALESLWEACRNAVERARPTVTSDHLGVRLRDLLVSVSGEDPDHLVHPVLIRLCAAFLDQGIAFWSMADRDAGLYRGFVGLYGQGGGLVPAWMDGLAEFLTSEVQNQRSAAESVLDSLDTLRIPEAERERFIEATLLALRGWAGMVYQVETRPDRVPVYAPPARLVDLLAVRLILERFAIAHLARYELGYDGPLSELRGELVRLAPEPTPPSVDERAYVFFQVSQILGRTPDDIARLTPETTAQVLGELESFSQLERRRIFHLAYERRHRAEILDAFGAMASEPNGGPGEVTFQVVFCIDEREESIRRHLEEIEPSCRTFGAAGFFGVAMYYRGASDTHAKPLCPIGIRPVHEVREEIEETFYELDRRRARSRRLVGRLIHQTRVGSRTLTRGTVLAASVGILTAVPLVSRVLFPRLTERLRRTSSRWMARPTASRLTLERDEGRAPSMGKWLGFTVEEMASIVRNLLEETGLLASLSPMVLVVGHGSSSLNNPHESAHDCGACGGGRGGPNARAFAQMANHPRVRQLLREQGLVIPESTIFLGAYHDSCDDRVTLYDVSFVPEPRQPELARLGEALDRACALNAHERCRRFESAPTWLTPSLALAHVEGRAHDLAQVRPEYGHATNAVCVIGRRERTRGLFLDRRAFLASYDPESDDMDGSILSRIVSSVVPVGAGINLEYYFSYVDPVGYGCGTKLPHNITGLVGVMDGYASDLRTGLPWQMVEIHEPVRLLVIVETSTDLLLRVVARNTSIANLVHNHWIQLATLSPRGADIHVLGRDGFAPYQPEWMELPVVGSSVEWYGGQQEHLGPARVAAPGESADQVDQAKQAR